MTFVSTKKSKRLERKSRGSKRYFPCVVPISINGHNSLSFTLARNRLITTKNPTFVQVSPERGNNSRYAASFVVVLAISSLFRFFSLNFSFPSFLHFSPNDRRFAESNQLKRRKNVPLGIAGFTTKIPVPPYTCTCSTNNQRSSVSIEKQIPPTREKRSSPGYVKSLAAREPAPIRIIVTKDT